MNFHYYIDGYNLLFRLLRSGDGLKHQREELIKNLASKINALNLDATLVFDSHYQIDDSTKMHFLRLEVVFTAKGETADEFILHAIKESHKPSHQVVVSSDKKLSWLARLRLAKTQSVEEFMSWLHKRYKNTLTNKKNRPTPPVLGTYVPKISPAPSNQSSKQSPPKKHVSSEDCFQYYLETFEKRAQAEISQKQKMPKLFKPKKHPKNEVKDSLISDTQRWLDAFSKPDDESHRADFNP